METDAEETSRLLEPERPRRTGNPRKSKPPNPWRTIVSVAAFVLILAFSSDLGFVPQTAILQDIVCESYYAQHHVAAGPSQTAPAEKCLIEPVQSEVAYINGWKDSLEILPGKFSPFPLFSTAKRSLTCQLYSHAAGYSPWRSGRPHRTQACPSPCRYRLLPERCLDQDSL